jgi:hypothetical protein
MGENVTLLAAFGAGLFSFISPFSLLVFTNRFTIIARWLTPHLPVY